MWKNTVKVTAPSQFPTVLFGLHNQPNWSPWVAGWICYLELLTVSLPVSVGVPWLLALGWLCHRTNPVSFLPHLQLCLKSRHWDKFKFTLLSPPCGFSPSSGWNRGWWVRAGKNDSRVSRRVVQASLQERGRWVHFSWWKAKGGERLVWERGW